MSSAAEAAIVIGVGNRWRRDDGAGPEAAARLRARGVDAVAYEGEPVGLLDRWEGAALAVAIDAADPAGAPGSVRRFDATHAALPAEPATASTHALGLGAAIELGRTLGRLPGRLVVFTIEGADFATGEGLSPAVAAALDTLVEAVLGELQPPA